jgi:hypothetical protein
MRLKGIKHLFEFQINGIFGYTLNALYGGGKRG